MSEIEASRGVALTDEDAKLLRDALLEYCLNHQEQSLGYLRDAIRYVRLGMTPERDANVEVWEDSLAKVEKARQLIELIQKGFPLERG